MFCPNCASPTSAEQKFCRACGLSLEKIAQVFAEQLPTAKPDVNLRERKLKLERLGMILLGSMVAGIFGFILFFGIIYKMIISEGKYVAGFGLMIFFISMIVGLILLLYAQLLGKTTPRPQPEKTAPQGKTTAGLIAESPAVIMPSVTEQTTAFLDAADGREVRDQPQLKQKA